MKGIFDIKKKAKTSPQFKILLGMMAAMVFIISCMPVPVPTAGTCSHPCGTGISAILVGPIMSVFITSIVLLIQALFLAHGGITTWGADIVSMGIAGSFAAFFSFKILQKMKAPLFICGFIAGVFADWLTYITTSFELASALAGAKPVFPLFTTILIAFVPTQLPLGILEGFLTGGMVVFVAKRRPDILKSLGIIKTGKKYFQGHSVNIVASLIFLSVFLSSPFVIAQESGKWLGVDESVVEKVAEEHGRKSRAPFINTDQGDLLLFVFLVAGAAAGFIMGYNFRRLFSEKNAKRDI